MEWEVHRQDCRRGGRGVGQVSEKRQVTQGPSSPQAVYVGGYGHRAAGHNAQTDATDTDREQSGGAERGAGGALRCGKRHRAGAHQQPNGRCLTGTFTSQEKEPVRPESQAAHIPFRN